MRNATKLIIESMKDRPGEWWIRNDGSISHQETGMVLVRGPFRYVTDNWSSRHHYTFTRPETKAIDAAVEVLIEVKLQTAFEAAKEKAKTYKKGPHEPHVPSMA